MDGMECAFLPLPRLMLMLVLTNTTCILVGRYSFVYLFLFLLLILHFPFFFTFTFYLRSVWLECPHGQRNTALSSFRDFKHSVRDTKTSHE